MKDEDDQDFARCRSRETSQNLETSEIEDDISVGDNRSETSTPKKIPFSFEKRSEYKKVGSEDPSSPVDVESDRIPNYDPSYRDDEENEFESRTNDRMKIYERGLFHIYRSERENSKEGTNEPSPFVHMNGTLSDGIYGRTVDLSKTSFQSQLLAGFAASVIAGSSQREQEPSGIIFCYISINHT